MMKVIVHIDGKPTLFLGLDRENTDRMHAGHPIGVDLPEILAKSPNTTQVEDVILFAGETLRDVYDELAKHVPGLPPFEEPEG